MPSSAARPARLRGDLTDRPGPSVKGGADGVPSGYSQIARGAPLGIIDRWRRIQEKRAAYAALRVRVTELRREAAELHEVAVAESGAGDTAGAVEAFEKEKRLRLEAARTMGGGAFTADDQGRLATAIRRCSELTPAEVGPWAREQLARAQEAMQRVESALDEVDRCAMEANLDLAAAQWASRAMVGERPHLNGVLPLEDPAGVRAGVRAARDALAGFRGGAAMRVLSRLAADGVEPQARVDVSWRGAPGED